MSVAEKEKVETFKNFVNGKWKASRNGATFENENPASRGSNIALFQSSTPDDVREAIDVADNAFRSWRRTPLPERQNYIAEFLRLLKESREELARIVTLENGKTIKESRAEVDSALVEGSYHLNQVAAFLGPFRPGRVPRYLDLGSIPAARRRRHHQSVELPDERHEPEDAAGVADRQHGCLQAGDVHAVVRRLHGAALRTRGLARRASSIASPGWVRRIGNVIVEDPRVRAISFTGSTEVGKKIQVKGSANLTRMQLELGGKNALIVMDDADIGEAVGAAVTAGFSNGGQWCTSTSRVLLHRDIAKPFLEALTARCEKMNVGDGLPETTDMGPVAGPQQFRGYFEGDPSRQKPTALA